MFILRFVFDILTLKVLQKHDMFHHIGVENSPTLFSFHQRKPLFSINKLRTLLIIQLLYSFFFIPKNLFSLRLLQKKKHCSPNPLRVYNNLTCYPLSNHTNCTTNTHTPYFSINYILYHIPHILFLTYISYKLFSLSTFNYTSFTLPSCITHSFLFINTSHTLFSS